jgi:hypothetical protein
MVPAAQRLAARNAHRVHRHDRLVDDTQATRLHGVAKVGLHGLAIAEGEVHDGLEDAPAVLAVLLGLVEGKVCLDDQVVEIREPRRRQHGACARLDAQRVAGDVNVALQARQDALQRLLELLLVLQPVKVDHELVTAEAADLDIVAGELAQPLGHGEDEPVADRMAERVVTLLKSSRSNTARPHSLSWSPVAMNSATISWK